MRNGWLVRTTSGCLMTTLIVGSLSVQRAEAGLPLPLPFATEVTQLLNHVELINSYLQEVTTAENEIKQYEDMVLHGLNFPQQLFGPVLRDLNQLGTIVQNGRAMAYSLQNLDGTFRLRFPGYGAVSRNYGQQYKSWSQTSLDSTLGALKAAGMQNDQLQSEQTVLDGLRSMSETSQGRMQAIQAGNQISEQQVEQLMKLRQIMLADMQSKAAFQSTIIQDKAARQANSDAFFGQVTITSDGYQF